MGKKRIIQFAVNLIALISHHKILHKQGRKFESKEHLKKEIKIYTEDGFEKIQEYKFNESELNKIKEKSIKRIFNILVNKYPDVKFTEKEVSGLVEETMSDLLL